MEKKKTYEKIKNVEDMEELRSHLYQHVDCVIESNIRGEVLTISRKLDKLINSFYRENKNWNKGEK